MGIIISVTIWSQIATQISTGVSTPQVYAPFRGVVGDQARVYVPRTACVGQSCDVTCVFSQGAEDGSFPEEL